jgi:hypothetical protein
MSWGRGTYPSLVCYYILPPFGFDLRLISLWHKDQWELYSSVKHQQMSQQAKRVTPPCSPLGEVCSRRPLNVRADRRPSEWERIALKRRMACAQLTWLVRCKIGTNREYTYHSWTPFIFLYADQIRTEGVFICAWLSLKWAHAHFLFITVCPPPPPDPIATCQSEHHSAATEKKVQLQLGKQANCNQPVATIETNPVAAVETTKMQHGRYSNCNLTIIN